MKWSIAALKSYPHWSSWLWASWGLQFALFEALGLDRVGDAVPLTWEVRDVLPLAGRAALWLWLGWHFVFSKVNFR